MKFDFNCTNKTEDELVHENLLWSISGMVSFGLTFVILVLLLFRKAYTSILQRLFLYFTIVTLLQLACIAMNIELQFHFEAKLSLCKWLGFIQHLVYVMNWLLSLTLTSYLHFLFYYQIKGNQLPTIGNTKKARFAVELLLLFILTALPFTVLLVPFSSYGLNGSLCWTQHLLGDCSVNVLAGTFELIYTYCCVVVRLLIVVSFLVLVVIFCKLSCKYRRTRKDHLKAAARTMFLMFFLIVSASIELVGLLIYIHTAVVGKYSTNVVEKLLKIGYVVLPFSLVIIPTGFMVYLYSKTFSWESTKRAAHNWKQCCILCSRWCIPPQLNEVASAPESTRESPPSNTRFTIRYTGGFTNVSGTKQEQVSLIPGNAVLSSGYESIISSTV